MITLSGNRYRLCLLDTNAVSEMAKRPDTEFRHFVTWAMGGDTASISCFSLFTVLELRKRPDIYRMFLDLFDQLPCSLLMSHEQLLEAEVAAYPYPASINPLLVAFPGALLAAPDRATLAASLEGHLSTTTGQQQERTWIDGAASIVDGMTSNVANYEPAGQRYTRQEIRFFVEWAGLGQIGMRAHSFMRSTLESGREVEIDAFPSIKMTAFTVFYKFYVDKQRTPVVSDAFDVIISAPTPYVDAVITERHQAEVIRKTKQQDGFLEQVQVFTLRDFRAGTPASSTGS